MDVVFLDFSKAFDMVLHKRLLHKVEAYGIRGKLLGWIRSFLKKRVQRVVSGEFVSSWLQVLSGLPQGSVLGPILFIIYINDPTVTMTNTCKLYADDTKILSKQTARHDSEILQNDIDNFVVQTVAHGPEPTKVQNYAHWQVK
jgi:ribonuclease P/MRP protein subunit RPP40